MLKQRLVRVLVGALIAVAPVATAIPADASSQYIGKNGAESRCANAAYGACLYYGSSITTAYWPANQSWSDLAGHYFWSGTGTGSGAPVKKDSMAMYCGWASECISYANTGYTGNYDYEYGIQVGALSLTSNNNGSIGLY